VLVVPDRPGYAAADTERWLPDPPKEPAAGRLRPGPGAVLHSSALRRPRGQDPGGGPGYGRFRPQPADHSLEVAQVGRELGVVLGCDPDVVDTACLAHDLGHPPFGHNGEEALNAVATGIGRVRGQTRRPCGCSPGWNRRRSTRWTGRQVG